MFRLGENCLGRPKIFLGEFSDFFENHEKSKRKIKIKEEQNSPKFSPAAGPNSVFTSIFGV